MNSTYVKNAWYVASWSQELEDETPTGFTILNEPVVVWRANGNVYALENRCAHRLAPLSLGRCEGKALRCMYHGLLFDTDGQCLEIPGQNTIPERARVRQFPAVEKHSWVWIWMGDLERADESLIPGAIGLDNPDWMLASGERKFKCEAKLINENLLDFSHLSFVHAKGFGATLDFAVAQPQWERLHNGVRYSRWIEDMMQPPGFRQTADKVDFYLAYDFVIPGIQLMWSGLFPVGTAKTLDYKRPNMLDASASVSWTNQAVTPVANGKTRYFFSTGPHRNYGGMAERDADMAMTMKAFDEDELILIGQQAIIDATQDPRITVIKNDMGITMYNSITSHLMAAEG